MGLKDLDDALSDMSSLLQDLIEKAIKSAIQLLSDDEEGWATDRESQLDVLLHLCHSNGETKLVLLTVNLLLQNL
jgi:hypothetical protein